MEIAATQTAPQTRLFSPAPRHAMASRRLMAVRAGSPTIIACLLAFGVLTASAFGGPEHHTTKLGTAAPAVAHVTASTQLGA